MKISDIIKLLQAAKDANGDIAVRLYDRSGEHICTPITYDIGLLSRGEVEYEYVHFIQGEP